MCIRDSPNINKIRLIEDMTLTHGERTRAYVKIEDGCNNFSSYCIIPYLRGITRSKDSGKVFEEVRGLVKNGYKEIVLTGIHLDSYLDDNCGDLCSLLEKLNNIEDLYRIRLGSVAVSYTHLIWQTSVKTAGKKL